MNSESTCLFYWL